MVAVRQLHVQLQLVPGTQHGGRDILVDAHDRCDAHQALAHQPLPLGVQRVKFGEGAHRLLPIGPRDPLARSGFPRSFEPAHVREPTGLDDHSEVERRQEDRWTHNFARTHRKRANCS